MRLITAATLLTLSLCAVTTTSRANDDQPAEAIAQPAQENTDGSDAGTPPSAPVVDPETIATQQIPSPPEEQTQAAPQEATPVPEDAPPAPPESSVEPPAAVPEQPPAEVPQPEPANPAPAEQESPPPQPD